jgi:mono/diheme cytochrome c family protein
MMNRAILFTIATIALLFSTACDSYTTRPSAASEVTSPNQIADFDVLYTQNCAGCHGVGGKDGAAIALADPVFLAIADDATIRRIAANGVPGTPMPAFAQSAGGLLTDKQIDVLVHGIRSWADAKTLQGTSLPSYAALTAGDPQRGADVFRTYCSSCHSPDGSGGKAGSIVDGSFLALVSDQELRMNVIVGRPALGAPDWRNDIAGRPLSEQEISDVVAWLAAQRPEIPGQPYPISAMDRTTGGIR